MWSTQSCVFEWLNMQGWGSESADSVSKHSLKGCVIRYLRVRYPRTPVPEDPVPEDATPSQFDKYFLKSHYNFCNNVNSRKTCWCLQSSKEWNRHKIVRELFNISNEISRIFSSHCTCTQPSSVARLVLQNTLFGTNLWFLRNLKIKISRYLKKY